ncbi:hypothetical protein [Endozoicomonas ascidiicola]|uniref:hypothetical protein n=1 Tax=Endozoicomonas ascidiicola TaxID=1698521 RepID=UPI0008326178|nr:hypothetical protein [Endozoicomonas ascidiicola]USN26992.1 hypothetical protein [synthetic construct]
MGADSSDFVVSTAIDTHSQMVVGFYQSSKNTLDEGQERILSDECHTDFSNHLLPTTIVRDSGESSILNESNFLIDHCKFDVCIAPPSGMVKKGMVERGLAKLQKKNIAPCQTNLEKTVTLKEFQECFIKEVISINIQE